MDIGEIIRESWSVYKRNFLMLVIPFLVLSVVISLVDGFVVPQPTLYLEDNTSVKIGVEIADTSTDSLDADDDVYYEVKAVENDGAFGLEVWQESQAIPLAEIADRWVRIALDFKSENSATYHLQIYNFSTSDWVLLRSDNVGATGEIWENSITTDPDDYIDKVENRIRIRLYTLNEENSHKLQIDCLVFGGIPKFASAMIGYLVSSFALLLGLTLCCGMAIETTQRVMSKKQSKLGDALKIAGLRYPGMLVATLIIAISLIGVLYLLLSFSWGIFLIPLALFFPFFCTYAWHGVVIRSLSPWGSVGSSFKITWGNLGATFVFWLLLVLGWFFIAPAIPIVGPILIWFLLPFWMVALSVTYMDRTGKLLESEAGLSGSRPEGITSRDNTDVKVI